MASPIAKRRAGCSVRAPSFAKVAIFAFPYPSGFFANSLSLPNATVIAKKPMLHFPRRTPSLWERLLKGKMRLIELSWVEESNTPKVSITEWWLVTNDGRCAFFRECDGLRKGILPRCSLPDSG